jgi:hypothetical protein
MFALHLEVTFEVYGGKIAATREALLEQHRCNLSSQVISRHRLEGGRVF